ncbi:MAG TPA: GTP cyclohydrolase II [Candidatus Altiarchaeales archaeon]|nr:GTP cyclohydrolase II [Candidatus Altiarchaeales archaeon]
MIKKVSSEAELPSKYGNFRVKAFEGDDGREHLAIYKGKLDGAEKVLARIHSECLTGDLIKSLKCDCGQQLEKALKQIHWEDAGVLVYLRQEGRGIGLVNKINAYCLQENGFDTVEANEELGFKPDLRKYGLAAEILQELGVKSVRLLTNNPEKEKGLSEFGMPVTETVPLKIHPNEHNRRYLETKKEKLFHLL